MSMYDKISHLIENQFPAFYKDEGPEFIAFVSAYYEWLEQNHQLLTLESTANFNVSDTVTQDNVTGTIIAVTGSDVLVHVDGVDTFKCFTICSSLIPISSSSGGNSYILRGGTTRRLGSLFYARHLTELFDIDSTLDLFINHFKLKYLSNIEFSAETNKRLLVKHSLDLYRSKGTERSIDLFFRLVYGASAKVYYPGDDLFKLSEGEWIIPQYIEIYDGDESRVIPLVGKQIYGVTSKASAFVERYVKRKIKGNVVHVLYISSVTGNFLNDELLISDKVYPNSPKVRGSLSAADIVSGGQQFNVGDLVNFDSIYGSGAIARVAAVSDKVGTVDFSIDESGFGYTLNPEILISDKVLTLSNVAPGNSVGGLSVVTKGTGYSNGDLVVVQSSTVNATAKVSTFANSAINFITLKKPGAGFVSVTPNVYITNSSGGATGGSGANLAVGFIEPNGYFSLMEQFNSGAANSIVVGLPKTINMTIDSVVNGPAQLGNKIYQNNAANSQIGQGTITSMFENTLTIGDIKGIFKPNTNIKISGNTNYSARVSSVSLQIGVDISAGAFVVDTRPASYTTGIYANVAAVSVGSGASFNIGLLSEVESVLVNSDRLANNTLRSLRLNSSAWGMSANATGNSSSILLSLMSYTNKDIGTIKALTAVNPGSQYNVPPFITVQEPCLSENRRRDYVIYTSNSSVSSFVLDEIITQEPITINKFDLLLTDETGYSLGERVYQGTIGSETAIGYVAKISGAANTVTVTNVTGSFSNTVILKSRINTGLSANVITITSNNESRVAKGQVKGIGNNYVLVKRLQLTNNFTTGKLLTGTSSGATAYVVATTENANTLAIGHNAIIDANVQTANGAVASLQIMDSGYGYVNGEVTPFTDDNPFAGEAKLIVSGIGKGSGYYMKNKGVVSGVSKIHDGDYYQEYSYDVFSRVSFDKYSDMFKKVMHTAGTRFFGSLLLEDVADIAVTGANSSITGANTNVISFTQANLISNTIVVDNQHLITGNRILYTTNAAAVPTLINNHYYYAYNANTTGLQLTTTPRLLSYTTDSHLVSNNSLYIARHNYQIGDVVSYHTDSVVSVVAGLANNTTYYVKTANTDYIGLSANNGGTQIVLTASSNSYVGHTVTIAPIVLATSGTVGTHYLSST